jgi:hypothetical protein
MKKFPTGHTGSIGGDDYGKRYFQASDLGPFSGNGDV